MVFSASASSRADRLRAEPITGGESAMGQATLVWVEGIAEPIVASHRTDDLARHGTGRRAQAPLIDQAVDLAEHLVAAVDAGRVDLGDLGRRARHLLESTTGPATELP